MSHDDRKLTNYLQVDFFLNTLFSHEKYQQKQEEDNSSTPQNLYYNTIYVHVQAFLVQHFRIPKLHFFIDISFRHSAKVNLFI